MLGPPWRSEHSRMVCPATPHSKHICLNLQVASLQPEKFQFLQMGKTRPYGLGVGVRRRVGHDPFLEA